MVTKIHQYYEKLHEEEQMSMTNAQYANEAEHTDYFAENADRSRRHYVYSPKISRSFKRTGNHPRPMNLEKRFEEK